MKKKLGDDKAKGLLEGRVLARVHAHESLMSLVRGGHAGPHDLTDKGDVSDIDEPPPK